MQIHTLAPIKGIGVRGCVGEYKQKVMRKEVPKQDSKPEKK